MAFQPLFFRRDHDISLPCHEQLLLLSFHANMQTKQATYCHSKPSLRSMIVDKIKCKNKYFKRKISHALLIFIQNDRFFNSLKTLKR